MSRAYNGTRGFSGAPPILGDPRPPSADDRHHDRMDTTQETRYHREVRATLDQVVELDLVGANGGARAAYYFQTLPPILSEPSQVGLHGIPTAPGPCSDLRASTWCTCS